MVKGECCELASSRNQSLDVGLWESVWPCSTGREVCVIVLITSQSLAGMDTYGADMFFVSNYCTFTWLYTLIVTWYWAPFNKRYPYTAFQISNVTALLLIHYLEIKNNYWSFKVHRFCTSQHWYYATNLTVQLFKLHVYVYTVS